MDSFITCLKKYADFSGRATRTEYWIFYLVLAILTNFPAVIGLVLIGLGEETGHIAITLIGGLFVGLACLIYLALMLPWLSVTVRRLHDIGKGGDYQFILLIPFAGPIILLLALCEDSQQGENQYGISEKYPTL